MDDKVGKQIQTQPDVTPFHRDRAIELIARRIEALMMHDSHLSPRYWEWAMALNAGSPDPRAPDFEPSIDLAFQAFMAGRESMVSDRATDTPDHQP